MPNTARCWGYRSRACVKRYSGKQTTIIVTEIQNDTTAEVDGTFQKEGGPAKERPMATKYARIINIALHPLLIPLYVMAVLLFGETMAAVIPLRSRWFFMLSVFFNTCLLPAIAMGLLYIVGFSPAKGVPRKYYALAAILLTLGCYIACIWSLNDIYAAYLVRRVLIAAIGCLAAGAIAGIFIYISPYMIAAGAATGTLLWIDISGLGTILPQIVSAILLSGILTSARMYLGHEKYGTGITYFASMLISAVLLSVL